MDVCEAIFKTLNYPKSDTFNIGSGKATKIRTLASLIIKKNRKGKIVKAQNTQFDALFSCANMYKTNAYLKFKSKLILKQV